MSLVSVSDITTLSAADQGGTSCFFIAWKRWTKAVNYEPILNSFKQAKHESQYSYLFRVLIVI